MPIRHFDQSSLERLRPTFAGDMFLPVDPGYEESRSVFNAMIDTRPAVIAQCATVNDVAAAVRFGREQSLEIAVRGGGHGVAGKALVEGGLVIDLRRLNGVSVDPERRTATVGGGATMGGLDRATEPFALATTGGRVSTTGVGGFTLGGGSGWLDRKFGLASDNLLQAEVVLADGSLVRVNEQEHADLFWALHGGGGNFGVVTSFTFQLHPLSAVTAALLIWGADSGPEIAHQYRDFMREAPDEVGGGFIYLTGPAEDFVPAHLVDQLVCAVFMTFAGAEADARRAMAPILGLGHEGEMIVEVSYADLQSMLDDPPGYRNYWTAEYLESFPDEAVERFCARATDMVVPSPTQQLLFPQGGAVARGPAHFPIPWRGASWCVHPFGLWSDPADDERAKRWARALRTDLQPWVTGAVYLNFVGDEGQDRVIAGFGRENYERLAQIKAQYDPGNVFRTNHNIKPGHAGSSVATDSPRWHR